MCPLCCTLGRPAKPSKFDLLPCCYSKLPAAHERLGTACRKYGVKFSSKRLPSIPFPERFGSSVTQYYVSLIRSFVVKHRCLQHCTSHKNRDKNLNQRFNTNGRSWPIAIAPKLTSGAQPRALLPQADSRPSSDFSQKGASPPHATFLPS